MGTITLHLRPAAHGDTNAQSVIYDRLYRELSPYAAVRARALRRFWEGADLLQHVFARFLFNPAKLSGFTSGSALREYARRSIDNQSRDIAKSAAFRRGSPAADLDFGAGWCADDINREIDREYYKKAVAMASAADPEGLVLLRLSESSSIRHAAEEAGVCVRTVQRRVDAFRRLVTVNYERLQA